MTLTDAIITRLQQHPILQGSVFDGDVTGDPQRYVRIFVPNGNHFADRLGGPDRAATYTITTHSVGLAPVQARAVSQAVIQQLTNWTPQVDGYRFWPLRHPTSLDAERDDTVEPGVYFIVDQFGTRAEPA